MSSGFYEQPNRVKLNHLVRENGLLVLTVKQLQNQMSTVRKINRQLMEKDHNSLSTLLKQLNEQNSQLQVSLRRLTKSNSQLLCEMLMKDQFICEIHKQYSQIIINYEEKISDLMNSLLKKQEYANKIERKYGQDKDTIIGLPTGSNLLYLNEINESKMYFDRLNIENSQLSYLNIKKEKEVERLKKKLTHIEQLFKNQFGENCEYIFSIDHSPQHQSIFKHNGQLKIETQMAKYVENYKQISTKKISKSAINDIKLILIHLNNQNITLVKEKIDLLQQEKKKKQQICILQEAYKKLQRAFDHQIQQISLLKVKLGLTKKNVAQDRFKIDQEGDTREDNEKQREALIKYWKKYQQNDSWKDISHKCILRIQAKPSFSCLKRSKSCLAHIQHRDQSSNYSNPQESQGFSYILESCNADLIVNQSISHRKIAQRESLFDEDISMITKPKQSRFKNDYDGQLKEIDFQE